MVYFLCYIDISQNNISSLAFKPKYRTPEIQIFQNELLVLKQTEIGRQIQQKGHLLSAIKEILNMF